jgi:hypothetical protein
MQHDKYWNHTGKYESVKDKVAALVPISGEVENPRKNKALEKYRKAANCYYDLYNNGLCNRASEFYHVFKIKSSEHKIGSKYRGKFTRILYELIEEKMDQFVLDAALEQKIITEDYIKIKGLK